MSYTNKWRSCFFKDWPLRGVAGRLNQAMQNHDEFVQIPGAYIATYASLTTIATSGATFGTAMLNSGGVSATYYTAMSLLNANTEVLQGLVCGGAVLGFGMLAAGVFDIFTQLIGLDSEEFGKKFNNPLDFMYRLVSIPLSVPVSVFSLVGHAILLLGYIIKSFTDLFCKSCELGKDAEEVSANFRSICYNLVAIICFPLINLVDLTFGSVKSLKSGVCATIDCLPCGEGLRYSHM